MEQISAVIDRGKSPLDNPTYSNASPFSAAQNDGAPDVSATFAPAAIEWAKTLTWMGALYPSSKFASMGTDELMATSAIWAEEFKVVPVEAIEDLRRRTLGSERAQKTTFAPSAADFRATWNDPSWDYYADMNRHEDGNAGAMLMLPPAATAKDGPGFTAAAIQNRRFIGGKGMMLCECVNPDTENRYTATLSPDKSRWICACEDRYAFSGHGYGPSCLWNEPLSEVDRAAIAAPEKPREKPKTWADKKHAAAAKAQEEQEETAPPVRPRLEEFSEGCDIPFEELSESQREQLGAFAEWCWNQTPMLLVDAESFNRRWDQWQFEIEEAA